MTGVFTIGERKREREKDKETHNGKGHVKTEAEVGVTLSLAREHQQPPEAGGGSQAPPLEPSDGARPCPHLDFRLLASSAGTG